MDQFTENENLEFSLQNVYTVEDTDNKKVRRL